MITAGYYYQNLLSFSRLVIDVVYVVRVYVSRPNFCL